MAEPSSSSTESPVPFRLTEGVVLGVLTGTAYLAAFAFEAGAAIAFGYPLEFIDVQVLPTLFRTLTSLAVLFWLWNFAGPLIAAIRPKPDDHPVAREVRPVLGFLIIVFAFWMVSGFQREIARWALWAAGVALTWLAFNLVSPVIVFRRIKGYTAKLLARQQGDHQLDANKGIKRVAAKSGLDLLILTCLIALGLSFTAGYGVATRQRSFLVIGQDPEWVILKIYGSRAIAAELFRPENGFRQRYRIVNVDGVEDPLVVEQLGPLTPLPFRVAPSLRPAK